VYTDLSLQLLEGDPSLGSVLAHSRAALHHNEDDPEVWIFRQRFGTPPSFPLPGVFLPQLLHFSF
jgi:hypothetical protein